MRRHFCWLLLLVAGGCNKQDTEALTRIGKKMVARADAVRGEIKTSAASGWIGAADATVESRVALRLKWDRQLAETALEVTPLERGVELRGKVRNLEQRRRAVMLAESTAGVEGVKDSLTESDR